MISLGELHEIEDILALTKACGKHMRDNGIDQWDENYPDIDSLRVDIETKTLFAYREGTNILGIVVVNEHQDEEYADINWSTSENDRNAVVHRLAVSPEHQGKGIAQKLMSFVEEYTKRENYDAIRLDTYSQNPRNQKFYRTRGYSELGQVYLKYKREYPYYCYELLLK